MKNILYRVIRRGTEKFALEARSAYGTWRVIEEFRNVREADAKKAKLEKIAGEADVVPTLAGLRRSFTISRALSSMFLTANDG